MAEQTLQREPQPKRFTVSDYHRMIEAGILGEDSHLELIAGEVIEMSPQGSPHASLVTRLGQRFIAGLIGRAICRVQCPVTLGEDSEPEPDLAIVALRDDYYASAHPAAGDILLVVEIGNSSAAYDRARKLPLYARAGVAAAWLIDLAAGTVTTHEQPAADGYAATRACTRRTSWPSRASPR